MRQSLLIIAAALSLGAAVIHFAAVGPHLEEFVPYAYAFAILGVVQVALAIGLLRGWRHVGGINIVVSAAVVGVWVISRTAGLPFGPEPWQPEEVGLADVIASAFEVALIAVVILATLRPRESRPLARPLASAAYVYVVPVSVFIGLMTLIAVAALGAPDQMNMGG